MIQTRDSFRFGWNNYEGNNKKFHCSEAFMLEQRLRHFSSSGRNGFLNVIDSVTFIDKTDPMNALKCDYFWRKTLKPITPYGLNIEKSIYLINYKGGMFF